MRMVPGLVACHLSLFLALDLPAQSPRLFVGAGLAGRHLIGANDAIAFGGVAARIGIEWIGRRLGWTASVGGDFATERSRIIDTPGLRICRAAACLAAAPAPGPIIAVPGAIYRASASLLITSDDQRRLVMSLGPAIYTGRTSHGDDLVWGGLGALTIHPFTQAPDASRIGLGVEASLLSSPLGRGVDWLMSPIVRITM